MAIAPDSKDWTWVLDRPCPQCGLDVREIQLASIAGMLRSNAAAWGDVVRSDLDVRRRPAPLIWSPLEYACHVRDVFGLYDTRLTLMLTEDDPLFENWDQDRTAVVEGYGDQDPETVRRELLDAATRLANDFDRVDESQWRRPGRRSDGAAFTVTSFARYLIHDPGHHLYDVTGRRGLPGGVGG